MNVPFVSVMACNDFGGGPWSDWMTFAVGPATAPSAPVVVQPGILDSEISYYVVAGTNPTIEWTAASGAVNYWVSVYDLTLWAPVYGGYIQVDAPTTSWTPDEPLLEAHIYEVIVAASNDFGMTWAQDWRTFASANLVVL